MVTREEIARIISTPENERTTEDFLTIGRWQKIERKRLIDSGVDKKKLSLSPVGAKKEWPPEYEKIGLGLKNHYYGLKEMLDTLFESTITDEKPKGQQYIHLHLVVVPPDNA